MQQEGGIPFRHGLPHPEVSMSVFFFFWRVPESQVAEGEASGYLKKKKKKKRKKRRKTKNQVIQGKEYFKVKTLFSVHYYLNTRGRRSLTE